MNYYAVKAVSKRKDKIPNAVSCLCASNGE